MHDLLHSLTGISKSLSEHFAKDSSASNPKAETDFLSLVSDARDVTFTKPEITSESDVDGAMPLDDLVSTLIENPNSPDNQSGDNLRGDVAAGFWPEDASGQAKTDMNPPVLHGIASTAEDKPEELAESGRLLQGTQDQKAVGPQGTIFEGQIEQSPLSKEISETPSATAIEGASPRLTDHRGPEIVRLQPDALGQAKEPHQQGKTLQNAAVGVPLSGSLPQATSSEASEGDEGENVSGNNPTKNLVAGDKVPPETPKVQLLFNAVRQNHSDLGGKASTSEEISGQQEGLAIESLQGINSRTGHPTTEAVRATISPTGIAQHAVQQVTFAIQNMKDGSIELQLNPEELGRVKLNLDNSEGQMKISIIAERAETADLLRRNLDHLSSELLTAGLEGVVISFGESTADSGEQQQHAASHSEQNLEQPVQSTFIHGPIAISEGVDLRI